MTPRSDTDLICVGEGSGGAPHQCPGLSLLQKKNKTYRLPQEEGLLAVLVAPRPNPIIVKHRPAALRADGIQCKLKLSWYILRTLLENVACPKQLVKYKNYAVETTYSPRNNSKVERHSRVRCGIWTGKVVSAVPVKLPTSPEIARQRCCEHLCRCLCWYC